MIRTGGEAVAPAEVEAVLRDHPGVADVAVLGLPDPAWGEVVCAAVVVAPGETAPDLADLRTFCAARLAPYKHPRRLEVVDEIPRTAATGQIQRRLVLERVVAAGEARGGGGEPVAKQRSQNLGSVIWSRRAATMGATWSARCC